MLLLGALAAGCSSGSAPTTYDLSAPTSRIGGSAGVQISVNEPAALQSLSTQQILVKDQTGAISFLGARAMGRQPSAPDPDPPHQHVRKRLAASWSVPPKQRRGGGCAVDLRTPQLRDLDADQRGPRGDVGEDRERGERADRQCAHFPGSRADSLGRCCERGPGAGSCPLGRDAGHRTVGERQSASPRGEPQTASQIPQS